MKWIMYLAVVAALCSTCISGAYAWVDDFESYPSDGSAPLGAPWENASSQGAQAEIGIDLSQGSFGPAPESWDLGHAFRPAEGNLRLIGSVYLNPDTTWEAANIGFTENKSTGGNGAFYAGAGTNTVFVNAYEDTGPVGRLRIISVKGAWDSYQVSSAVGITQGIWYDTMLEATGLTITGYYKEHTSSTWLNLGSVSAFSGFAPNYVGISGNRRAYIDNVGAVPEPGSMLSLLVMGVGAVAYMRRRS